MASAAGHPTLFLLFFVVLNDLSDDEVQKLLGKFRVKIGPICQVFEPCDLCGFARRIGRGKVVAGFQFPDSLCMLEPLTERVDKDCVQPVDTLAVLFEQFRSALGGVSQVPILSV